MVLDVSTVKGDVDKCAWASEPRSQFAPSRSGMCAGASTLLCEMGRYAVGTSDLR